MLFFFPIIIPIMSSISVNIHIIVSDSGIMVICWYCFDPMFVSSGISSASIKKYIPAYVI